MSGEKVDVQLGNDGNPQTDGMDPEKIFWMLTDRHKKTVLENMKPSNYHNWGEQENIYVKSASLRDLVLTNGLDRVTNYERKLVDVLKELEINYQIHDIPSNNPEMKGVMYELQSFPPWSFGHFALTRNEAASSSAKKALSFLMKMCSV